MVVCMHVMNCDSHVSGDDDSNESVNITVEHTKEYDDALGLGR